MGAFDRKSGSRAERLIFNNRTAIIVLCALITAFLGFELTRLQVNASFEKMIPTEHPFIKNYLENRNDLKGLGNNVRIIVSAKDGTILDAGYLKTLQKINDEVLLLPGVDRAYMKSLWTPATRWIAVTEHGLDGGPVIDGTYDGTPEAITKVRVNIERSGEVGQLVAGDFKSSAIVVPLLDHDADGNPLDYKTFSESLEEIRSKYQSDSIDLHIIGFLKLVGDLIDALLQVWVFFLVAVIICTAMVYWFNRDIRSTVLVVICSLIAVVWQLGLLSALGFVLDPYSTLVPFLVFAIGMSHGTQKMNGILQDIGRGTHKFVAARYTFRRLFAAGLTALLCDAVGFAVLGVIKIDVIHDLAITASIGVAVLVFTNLVLLPILLSYCGVSPAAARRSLESEAREAGEATGLWKLLAAFTDRRWAAAAIVGSTALGVAGFVVAQQLKIGDLDPGAPELRPDSRYNRDIQYVTSHYATSSDVFVAMIKTEPYQCVEYSTQMKVDVLEQQLRQLPGVESTHSLVGLSRNLMVGMNEGNLRWFELVPNASVLGNILTHAPRELFNQDCTLLSVFAYLKDHKADTLTSVVDAVEAFAGDHATPEFKVLLAAGNAGIEAATNIVVKRSSTQMLYLIYGAVTILCFIAFRSWRAVVIAMVPLVLTSILCEALMVLLGIGVKVATLPVIALGVGIGVDYALYVVSVLLANVRKGDSVRTAYLKALSFTGKVVLLTGITLGAAVITWVMSPIKFQADMGVLLAFMFVWNMVGALILVPALAAFLISPKETPESFEASQSALSVQGAK
ncbi:MAG TPA: MMPL family transporter [Vicinamibacterales bacterium]|nr:MMPL family transporter [Vicinamibacterales bacterium]